MSRKWKLEGGRGSLTSREGISRAVETTINILLEMMSKGRSSLRKPQRNLLPLGTLAKDITNYGDMRIDSGQGGKVRERLDWRWGME